jgi:hypothetical protein
LVLFSPCHHVPAFARTLPEYRRAFAEPLQLIRIVFLATKIDQLSVSALGVGSVQMRIRHVTTPSTGMARRITAA